MKLKNKIKRGQNYSLLKTTLLALDIFVSIIIIITSETLIQTTIGKVSLLFGFLLILLVTALKIIEKL